MQELQICKLEMRGGDMERRAQGEGTIKQRPDGRWESQIRLKLASGTHKRVSVYGKTKGEVARKIAEVRRKEKENLLILTKPPTLGMYLNEWWPSGNDIKSTTYGARELNTKRISNVIGSVPLDKVSIAHIKMLDKHLKENGGQKGKGLSASSRRQALAILRTALGAAYAEDRIGRNPFSKWRRQDAPKAKNRLIQVLSISEQSKLFSLNDEWTPLWKIQLATANRIGETLALTWDDLELPKEEGANGLLSITKALHRRNTTMAVSENWLGHGEHYYLDKPKTRTSKRTIVLTPYVVQIFKTIKARQEAEEERIAEAGGKWSNPEGFVFTRFLGEPITPDAAWRWLQVATKKGGIKSVGVHALRHTMITDQILAGTPMAAVSKTVGHSSVAFTMDVYGHLTKEMESKVAEAASRILEEAEKLAELQGVANG